MPDVARALVTLGTDERAWGRAWHVPTNPPISQREALAAICRLASVPAPKLAPAPRLVLLAAGLVSPMLRELDEVRYQFERPFVLDSSAFTATFGIEPTPMDEALAATAAWWKEWVRKAA